MSNIRFLNRAAKQYHDLLNLPSPYLLIVTWGEHSVQNLMTVDGYEAFRRYLTPIEAATVQTMEILPESAARLGYSKAMTAEDVKYFFSDPDEWA